MLTVSAETRGAMVAYTFGGVNIAPEVAPPPPQTRNEERLIELWLHQRSEHTRRAYLADIARFRAFIACRPLGTVTLDELEQFAQTLEHMAPRSQCRVLASVKSLFSYAAQLRYMQYDAARPLRLPKIPCDLAKRILDEEQVVKMISLETKPRNAAMLRLFYSAGLRVSELCSLRWRDLQPRGESGQVVVTGKGTKTRSVLVSPSTWAALEGIRGEAGPDAPVFLSQKNTPVSTSWALQLVRRAAHRAGIAANVSPHWLRHCHASHALDRGAPAHLVCATLGHASLATTTKYAHARPNESSGKFLAV